MLHNIMTMEVLKTICKTCVHRNKQDNLFYMAFWSHCQTNCKLKKMYEVSQYTDEIISKEIEKNHEKAADKAEDILI